MDFFNLSSLINKIEQSFRGIQYIVLSSPYIDVAKTCKADAVKFQLFSGKNLYPDNYEIQKIFNSIELNIDWVDELLK